MEPPHPQSSQQHSLVCFFSPCDTIHFPSPGILTDNTWRAKLFSENSLPSAGLHLSFPMGHLSQGGGLLRQILIESLCVLRGGTWMPAPSTGNCLALCTQVHRTELDIAPPAGSHTRAVIVFGRKILPILREEESYSIAVFTCSLRSPPRQRLCFNSSFNYLKNQNPTEES